MKTAPLATPTDGSTNGMGSNTSVGLALSGSGVIAQQTQDTDQYKYLYFYVGTFSNSALENTAGLNASLFNGKADLNLLNTANNVDFVVESQEPTAGNDYTWYRKYRSGWVEQGGYVAADNNSYPSKSVALPITMANTDYQVRKQIHSGANLGGAGWDYVADKSSTGTANTTTTVYLSVASVAYCFGVWWEVKGKAA